MAWVFWGLVVVGMALVAAPLLLPMPLGAAMAAWAAGGLLLLGTLTWGAWAWSHVPPRAAGAPPTAEGLRMPPREAPGELPWAA